MKFALSDRLARELHLHVAYKQETEDRQELGGWIKLLHKEHGLQR